MNIAEQLVVFFISWWLVLFIVLPIGIQSADEAGEKVEPGHDPGAPTKPRLLLKMGITTLIAALILLVFHLADKYNLVTVQDFYN